MAQDLNALLGTAEVAQMIRSWLAWSATNIVFDHKGRLLLGVRAGKAQAIPEPGDYALIGGFNTEVDTPAMFADVANAHLKAQLGIEVRPEQCTGFIPCEYEMADIPEPLKTPFGAMPIKRVAFDRVVVLDDEQVAAITPAGKLRDVVWVDGEAFDQLAESGKLSFPHQVPHVDAAFDLISDLIDEDRFSELEDFGAHTWSE